MGSDSTRPARIGMTAQGNQGIAREKAHIDSIGENHAEEPGEFPLAVGFQVPVVEENASPDQRLHS